MHHIGRIEEIHRIAWDYLQGSAPSGMSDAAYLLWAESRMNALMALGRLESFLDSTPDTAEESVGRDPDLRRMELASGLLRAIDEICRAICDAGAANENEAPRLPEESCRAA